MSKRIDIKPPNWSKELSFEEFKKLNPLINENQIIHLYNQYLAKFLTELRQQKVHFKQSLNKNLQLEINKFQKKYNQTLSDTELKLPNINYDDPRGGRYPKGIEAEATIALLYDQDNHPQNSFDSAYSSQLENRTLILEATNGTFHTFTTVSGLTTYEDFIQNLTNQINSHPLFTAQYTLAIADGQGARMAGQTKGRHHLIYIQQAIPGSSGNTTLEGTLELASEIVTYTDFTGGETFS
jgi:hypothetical protein